LFYECFLTLWKRAAAENAQLDIPFFHQEAKYSSTIFDQGHYYCRRWETSADK